MPPVPVPGFTTDITFPADVRDLSGTVTLLNGARVEDLVFYNTENLPFIIENGYIKDGSGQDSFNTVAVDGNVIRVSESAFPGPTLNGLVLYPRVSDFSKVACGSYSAAEGFTSDVSSAYSESLAPIFAADNQSTHVAVYAPDDDFEIESASCNNNLLQLVYRNTEVAIFESSTALIGIEAQFVLTAAASGGQQRSVAIGVTWLSS